MDSAKIKTLEQVHDALDLVEDARSDVNLLPSERTELEKASVQLRNLERNIIKQKEQELIEALKSDTKELSELVEEMDKSTEKLAKIGEAIQKANKIVEDLIKLITKALSAGLV